MNTSAIHSYEYLLTNLNNFDETQMLGKGSNIGLWSSMGNDISTTDIFKKC